MSALPRHFDTIVRPVVTEKSTLASEAGTIVFETDIQAGKQEIREAVEAIFEVKVQAVNTVVIKGKRVRFRGRPGRRKDVKKAYVRLEAGYHIDPSVDL